MINVVNGMPLYDAIKLKKLDAFRYLYEQCWQKVHDHIVKNQGNEMDARGIFHDSILSIYELIFTRKLSANDDVQLEELLMQIAKFKRLYKSNPNILKELVDGEESEDNIIALLKEVLNAEHEFSIQPRLHKLTIPCQKILQLYFWENKSLAEIASIMNLSIDDIEEEKNNCLDLAIAGGN